MTRETLDCREIAYESRGKPVAATLCYPGGERDRRAAVIYLHGSAAEAPPPPGFPYTLDEMMLNFLYRDLAREGLVSLGIRYFSQTPSPGDNPESFLDAPLSAIMDAKPTWLQCVKDGFGYLADLPDVDRGRVALVAWSMGAWIAIHSAAEIGKYAALALISPWLDPADDVDELARGLPPTLILHGTGDDLVPVQVARHIAAAIERSHVPIQLVEFPGGNHQWTGRQGDEGFAMIVKFLNSRLARQVRLVPLVRSDRPNNSLEPTLPARENGESSAH